MNIDLSQFAGVFFEETDEHLGEMEHLLLAINVDAPEQDVLDSIFRAAHSIKGSAGIFGFQAISSVTHILENLLDQLRSHQQNLRAEMVDVFLRAVDVLRGLADAYKHQRDVDMAGANQICETLEQLAHPQQHAESQADDGSWGLFLLAPGENAAHTKTEVPATTSTSADTDAGYGFFEPLPTTPANTGAPAASSDDSYGFFEPLPDAQAKSGIQPGLPASEDAYGFFVELPGAAATEITTTESQQKSAPATVSHRAPTARSPVAPSGTGAEKSAAGTAANSTAASSSKTGTTTATSTAAAANSAGENASIRVNVDKIDQIINLVSELVITQAMLAQRTGDLDVVRFQGMFDTLSLLERNTRDLQEAVMSIRMMPMAFIFNRFPRVVRDIAGRLNKKIELLIEGEDTEMDKGLIEKLADPLTHLVRNSADHGIETADQRAAAGKKTTGTIRLSAFQRSGHVVVEVADDGAGLNRERILAKARERELPVSDDMSDAEVWQLIFAPGFSTADQVTDISGRGVGMDVVKRNIHELGGKIELQSFAGMGTITTIRLPLTLAILDGMVVAVGDERYIIPLVFISESLQPKAAELHSVNGREHVVKVRDDYIPLAPLHSLLGITPRTTDPTQGLVVILESDGRRIALQVDELLGQQQVVIKSLESNYRRVDGISAATIMGDGRVALILNIEQIVERCSPARKEQERV